MDNLELLSAMTASDRSGTAVATFQPDDDTWQAARAAAPGWDVQALLRDWKGWAIPRPAGEKPSGLVPRVLPKERALAVIPLLPCRTAPHPTQLGFWYVRRNLGRTFFRRGDDSRLNYALSDLLSSR